MSKPCPIYIERGAKRVFAGGLEWPGWCRQGKTEAEAIEALFAAAKKYEVIVKPVRLGFTAPKKLDQMVVTERLRGNATTDFGAPAIAPSVDRSLLCTPVEVRRYEKILAATWAALDAMVDHARGKRLSTGPRGGGRSLEGIVKHVLGAEAAYLSAVGWKAPEERTAATMRAAILAALKASAAGELPRRGPRGGKRWTARYFVRRTAWHTTAHIWEIERRLGEF